MCGEPKGRRQGMGNTSVSKGKREVLSQTYSRQITSEGTSDGSGFGVRCPYL